jgi:DNA-binding MarR family transcriptional regulator
MEKEDIHVLRLMGEIEKDGSHSQRELSRRLNLSLGLVNTFLKRLVNKGYFKVKTMPRNRVKYFLTPKGLARKSRLTVEYLRYSVDFYKEVKKLLLSRYREMEEKSLEKIVFFGAGEVAELAYLYLQPTQLKLKGIIDDKKSGEDFFGFTIEEVGFLKKVDWNVVLVTRLEDIDGDLKCLLDNGVKSSRIATL